MLLVRSGLSILMDHPRLYWNRHCTPNSEWMRLTPLEVPTDREWTAKEDARYISPWMALPGYRHTVGMARSWHFLAVYGFLLNGFILSRSFFHRPMESVWFRFHGKSFPPRGKRLSITQPSICRRNQAASINSITATAFILRCHFRHATAVHVDRDSDVSGG